MKSKKTEKNRGKKYLFGLLTPKERKNIEDQFFRDNDFFEDILDTEEELIEQYINDKLSEKDRILFEQKFLNTNEKVKKIMFSKTLTTELKNQKANLFWQNIELAFKLKIRKIYETLTSSRLRVVGYSTALIAVIIVGYFIIMPGPTEIPKIDEVQFTFLPTETRTRGQTREQINKYAIEIKTDTDSDIYLYLLYLDENKNITILFPNSNFSTFSNPLEADNTYSLPSSEDWFSRSNIKKSDIIILAATSQSWEEMEQNLILLKNGSAENKINANLKISELILKAEKNDNYYLKIFPLNQIFKVEKHD